MIELIAVLVILAVIALIATPLVLNIVKKTKDSSNKRSVDAYGKAVELAVATYLLDTGDYPTTLDDLTIEYSGNEVVCNIKKLNEDGRVYLSECSVAGREVKDTKTEDGWYHFGKMTTDIIDTYKIGDIVTYSGMDFYVIANNDDTTDYITLLKVEPLTVDEVNKYGAGHVNNYATADTSALYYQKAYDQNGYGGIMYYSSSTCGYPDSGWTDSECTNDYDLSDIKYVVDNWSNDVFKSDVLVEDNFGYKARLIRTEEVGCDISSCVKEDIYEFLKKENSTKYYEYWTMNPGQSSAHVIILALNGFVGDYNMTHANHNLVVRPVINIKQSELSKNNS